MSEGDVSLHYHSAELELEVTQPVDMFEEEEVDCDTQMHHSKAAKEYINDVKDDVSIGEG